MATHDVRDNERTPGAPARPPGIGGKFDIDENVLAAFPVPGTTVLGACASGRSLWGRTTEILTHLPDGKFRSYFLKPITGENGQAKCEGEYESIKAIHAVTPGFVPQPWGWGQYANASVPTFFMLADYREVGLEIPHMVKFTARLAELHKNSVSPTGKFGFHVTTCQAMITQITDCWESSWEVLYRKQLAHVIKLDVKKHGAWPEFEHVCRLTLDKVIPRLLGPLQSDGRTIKPCLVHGDLWEENTATDVDTGEPFVFDAGSFYAHNEYEFGGWRPGRHRMDSPTYIENYKRFYPVSEPEEDWDARNQLYYLKYNLCNAVLIPNLSLRQEVYEDMKDLCRRFCPEDLASVNHI